MKEMILIKAEITSLKGTKTVELTNSKSCFYKRKKEQGKREVQRQEG